MFHVMHYTNQLLLTCLLTGLLLHKNGTLRYTTFVKVALE